MLTCSVPLMYELILTYYFISFLLYNLLKIRRIELNHYVCLVNQTCVAQIVLEPNQDK